MHDGTEAAWDGATGTAGGRSFGAALRALAAERGLDSAALAAKAEMGTDELERVWAGAARIGPAPLARLASALGLRAVEFLQKSDILSLAAYAGGLDPLYFLPDGGIRHDARIYMREINPRHSVPERDMLRRNPVLQALAQDEVLDALGKLELELTYLLRAAAQTTGGTL